MYTLLRPLLFRFDAETAHHLTLSSLQAAYRLGLSRLIAPPAGGEPVSCMGITFPNAVGLAAGLDKNGAYIDALAALGFGFIEIGTVTPRPQPGNPKPRLFRLPQAEAIINRMGFNNDGVDALIANVRAAKFRGVLGINIGKNFDTPITRAADDYLACLQAVYPHASYVAVNISSPNTKNLRDLQSGAALSDLLGKLKAGQTRLAQQHGRYVPLAVKIAPDLDDEQIAEIAQLLRKHQLDGVIATNTTLARSGVEKLPHGNEAGGLSGAPVRDAATRVIGKLATALAGEVPIIGVGGILSAHDAREKILAGASLVQLYSGLIYRGPALVSECVQALRSRTH
ncbi:dihydroorotate dehydrogenase [Sulfuriferula multivorans]|uniref:Dihydroorotate dehydrogenase (quinone) n=1 Tax=Sulfuriferula multivorans TaxID=1559896 RepID=A0A401JAB2_9PROT|nr:quinone-dependent dihydroorotate dehydrogenase [Sulfuriferula multivorans]GBL44510.1 dihydroorotate dehydrogenase [Sulfuriferula multivorans]